MTAACFVDTNVLLYAASNAAADQPKRVIARRLLSEPNIGFSAQVFNVSGACLPPFFNGLITCGRTGGVRMN